MFAPTDGHAQFLVLTSAHFQRNERSRPHVSSFRFDYRGGEEFVTVDLARAFSFERVLLRTTFRCLKLPPAPFDSRFKRPSLF